MFSRIDFRQQARCEVLGHTFAPWGASYQWVEPNRCVYCRSGRRTSVADWFARLIWKVTGL